LQRYRGKGMIIQENDRVAYISEMTQELAGMARTDGFNLLAYLLEMARLEAEAATKKCQNARRR
jgi:hypothetical protein